MGSWEQTKIWKDLSTRHEPEDESVKATLTLLMPQIEAILTSGGTAPLDFTLHDAQHSFRVAQRMAEIIPSDAFSKLTTYELALLLLAAYLHDIGMTPERGKVSGVYNYLLMGDPNGLSPSEMGELQGWLDDQEGGVAPFTLASAPTPESLQKTRELTTYFCRDRHNDWSAAWIRDHLSGTALGSYNGWVEDLVALCRSHHEGYRELKSDRFDPRGVGAHSRIVHLRYLAAALRVADVLDVDPERTPQVILRHRDISPSSLIYWRKDQEVSIHLEHDQIVITARPSNARIHKAVEATVNQVNEELSLCRKLADETHFENCRFRAEKLPHHWVLAPSAHDDILPRDDAYEYIDGSFRPDTEKLLQLLSGIELYGSEMVAVREMLQNAFDAVREQIAYGRLDDPDPASAATERKFAEIHRVDLRLESSADGAWLVCKDSGVGMTKGIITDHLLVSGVAKRHDVLELDRRCRNAGFSLGRTGRFGIGVLSYFMLADRVIIRTRRSLEPGDSELGGWRFESEGVGSFGELRRDASVTHGTETRLHLRQEEYHGDLPAWLSRLSKYVKSTLVRVPCRFVLSSNLSGVPPLELGPGFTRREEDFKEVVASGLAPRSIYRDGTPMALLSTRKRKELDEVSKYWEEAKQEIRISLRLETTEGALPNGLGRFRVHLPYFDLRGGRSLAFLRVRKGRKLILDKIGAGYCYVPVGQHIRAWNGMAVAPERGHYGHLAASHFGRVSMFAAIPGLLEVDFTSEDAGRINVSRSSMKLSGSGNESWEWLERQRDEICRDFFSRHNSSVYVALNGRITNSILPSKQPRRWLVVRRQKTGAIANWARIVPPFITAMSFAYESTEHLRVFWVTKPVPIVPGLGNPEEGRTYDGVGVISRVESPDRIVLRTPRFWSDYRIFPLWTGEGRQYPSMCPAGLSAAFPPPWAHVCGVGFEHYTSKGEGRTVWNPGNKVIQSLTSDGWQSFNERFAGSLDPTPHKSFLLQSAAHAASWVVTCISTDAAGLWEGLRENDPAFLRDVWHVIYGSESAPVSYWVDYMSDDRLRILTPKSWLVKRPGKREDLQDYLPIPSDDWLIRIEDMRLPKLPKRRGSPGFLTPRRS